jgi:hypothetical protein
MTALHKAQLYCNPKKSQFYLTEVTFLGHRISQQGIKACSSKVEKSLKWPTPKTATDVHSFLGLVHYIAAFLPHLADHTTVLTLLTMKECEQKNSSVDRDSPKCFQGYQSSCCKPRMINCD